MLFPLFPGSFPYHGVVCVFGWQLSGAGGRVDGLDLRGLHVLASEAVVLNVHNRLTEKPAGIMVDELCYFSVCVCEMLPVGDLRHHSVKASPLSLPDVGVGWVGCWMG